MGSTDWNKVAEDILTKCDKAEGVAVVLLNNSNIEKGHEYNRGNFSGIIGAIEMQRRNKDWHRQQIGKIAESIHQNNIIILIW